MAAVPALPYPHQCNDCEMCRGHDADVHVLGEAYNQPGERPLMFVPALPRPAHGAAGHQRKAGRDWTGRSP